MELVVNNSFQELSYDEINEIDGGGIIDWLAEKISDLTAGYIGGKIGGAVGGPVGAVLGGILGVAVAEVAESLSWTPAK